MLPNEPQRAFAAAIFGDAAPAALRPAGRLAIYRNNVFAGLLNALKARFPVTRRLLGEECFIGCALHFIGEDPPSSPVLSEYGEAFIDFLAMLSELRSCLICRTSCGWNGSATSS